MPYTTIFVDDGKGVHKTGTGTVTGLEIFSSAVDAGNNEERTKKLRYGLIDFSGTTEMKVTPDDIRKLVEVNRKTASYTQGALVAVVAPPPLPYAMARLWHSFSESLGWKANVFHTRADAVSWLRKEIQIKEGTAALEQYPSLKAEQ